LENLSSRSYVARKKNQNSGNGQKLPENISAALAVALNPMVLKGKEDWLGGLDSSRRNLKTTVKLSKLLFSNHLSRFALQPSTTFRNPQRRDSTLNV
jgi:hypothetical protein